MALREETLAEYKILSVRPLQTVDAERDLEWICRSFGFLEPRDKKKTAYGIFRALVEAARHSAGLSSDELAEKLDLTRGTMVHHLNKMIKSGLVIHHEGQYKLRGRSLKSTIEEVQRDVNRIFEDLYKVAETIDQTLGLYSR
ncbi:MAG: winged helix-turn-helix domain-containing protein [Candidatus Bathyarchaeia archaeon]